MIALHPHAIYFPHPSLSDDEGLLCLGGNLSVHNLILAYKFGIFPWYNENSPILWWSPNPRAVLFPEELRVSKSMRPYFNQGKFQVSYDQHFDKIMKECAFKYRHGQDGTWITPDVIEAYNALHSAGYAHSVEVYRDGILVGGLYGVSLGNVFYGESMFANVNNASKFGFIALVRELEANQFRLIDCQQKSQHLLSLGARSIQRTEFMDILKQQANYDTKHLMWQDLKDRGIHHCKY